MRRLTSLRSRGRRVSRLACMQLLVRQVLDQPAQHMWAGKRCLVLDYLAIWPWHCQPWPWRQLTHPPLHMRCMLLPIANAATHGDKTGMPGELIRSCEGASTLLSTECWLHSSISKAAQHGISKRRTCGTGHWGQPAPTACMGGPAEQGKGLVHQADGHCRCGP